MKVLFLVVLSALLYSQVSAEYRRFDDFPSTQASIADGPIVGFVANGTRNFLGVPYGTPPVDSLRWEKPVAAKPWTTPYDATAYKPGKDVLMREVDHLSLKLPTLRHAPCACRLCSGLHSASRYLPAYHLRGLPLPGCLRARGCIAHGNARHGLLPWRTLRTGAPCSRFHQYRLTGLCRYRVVSPLSSTMVSTWPTPVRYIG